MGLWESSSVSSQSGDSVYTDLLTFAFRGPVAYNDHQPLVIDAEDPSRALTAGQFRLLVRTLIAGLQAHHVQRGDCVLVHLGNSIIYPALFFSIIGAGGVYMGSNPRSQPSELDHILELAEPKLIITSADALPTVLNVSVGRGMLPSQVCLLDVSAPDYVTHLLQSGSLAYPGAISSLLPDGGEGYRNFAHLLAYGENDWVAFNDEAIAKSTPAAMYSTSGTGGLPKAAIMSHHTVISHHLSIQHDVPYNVTRLMSLPMFHLFGALWAHLFTVRYGQPLFVLPRFELTQFVAAVHQYQITETYMVPAMIHVFNQSALPMEHFLSSMRYVGVAGAPIDGASMQRFQYKLHSHATVGQIWGMTETGVVFQNRYGERDHPGSIGRQLPGYDVRLVRDGNLVTTDNVSGELYVRGAGVLASYKGRDDAKDANGWFRTGDVAFVKNGYYYIVGRTKELLKVRGWQVAPAELEAVLLKHPDIEDTAVIGVNAPDGSSEVPRAFVVRTKGLPANHRQPTEGEIYKFARRQLASYKALDGGVIFVEEIPRTPSGKIQRFKLAQMNEYRTMMERFLTELTQGKVGALNGGGGNQSIRAIGIVQESGVTA